MKRIFTIALVALATMFTISCNRDLVGTKWVLSFGDKDELMLKETIKFVSDKDVVVTSEAYMEGEEMQNEDHMCTYTLDGDSISFFDGEELVGTFVYNKVKNVLVKEVDAQDAATMEFLGIEQMVYHKQML